MPEVESSDGLRIVYDVFGSGQPVLLLHPANATRRAWPDLGWIDRLASAGFLVVTLDSRGFGDSDRVRSPEDLGPGTSSLDISAVMDALGLDTGQLCGFSLGAAQALRFALDEPERVDSLVLGGLAVGPLAQMGLHLSRSAEAARAEALAQAHRILEKAAGDARTYFLLVQSVLSTAPLAAITPSGLGPPILGLAGAADPYDPPALYRTLSSGGARIETSSISGVGHGSCFTHSEFLELAARFVAAQAGRSTSGCR